MQNGDICEAYSSTKRKTNRSDRNVYGTCSHHPLLIRSRKCRHFRLRIYVIIHFVYTRTKRKTGKRENGSAFDVRRLIREIFIQICVKCDLIFCFRAYPPSTVSHRRSRSDYAIFQFFSLSLFLFVHLRRCEAHGEWFVTKLSAPCSVAHHCSVWGVAEESIDHTPQSKFVAHSSVFVRFGAFGECKDHTCVDAMSKIVTLRLR